MPKPPNTKTAISTVIQKKNDGRNVRAPLLLPPSAVEDMAMSEFPS